MTLVLYDSFATVNDGPPIHLTPTEFRMLRLLVRRERGVVSLADLSYAASKEMAIYDPGQVIKTYIRRIRRKLGLPGIIVDVRGFGYRLMAKGSIREVSEG